MEKPLEVSKPLTPKWFLECTEHGRQEAIPTSVQRWDEETEQILRSIGDLKEGEHFCTGNCPVCGTTKQAFTLNQEDKGSTLKHR